MTRPREWNHNTYFHDRLLRQLPERIDSALDIGCGDGRFATELARRAVSILAIDSEAGEVAKAAERCGALPNVEVRQADFLASGLPARGFDFVTALASLHHMDLDAAATEVRRVLRPGGTFVLLGVWTDRRRRDLPRNLASVLLNRSLQRRWGPDEMSSPVVLPTAPFADVRRELQQAFPGAVVHRHLLWRFTLHWQMPA